MLYVFRDKKYYDLLLNAGIDFLNNYKRAYVLVSGLIYYGKTIHLAIPLHANISPITQKEGWFLEIKVTDHTKAGYKAGLNLAKALPYKRNEFLAINTRNPDLKYAELIIKQNMPIIRKLCQEMLTK